MPHHAQMLSTFKVLDLFTNDEMAQKICSSFEDPDIVLAINELAKVSRAHQQEEQEICLARHQSCVRQTMTTILLDQLQSWGFERELYDVLKENAVPSCPLPACPPAYRQSVRFSPIIDNSPSPQISPSASTPSRSPIPTPTPRRSPKTMTRQRSLSTASSSTTNCSTSTTSVTCYNAANPDIFAQDAPSSNASTATNTHPDILSETAAITQKTSNTLTPIMEELTRIFLTMPELPTPQVNHMETIEATEVMDFTPSEA
ncbi:hypothetical protein CVT25_004596 [Psilocybe cyanescens]|uniref:Uncharacterized protein n=1 Tax=Psilocybe cyanescens TaxID=93625 RepID=A0A409XWF5_PSICY|nr:hypothetical protein CVT25_004596 [Psilocybe cyanescens]